MVVERADVAVSVQRPVFPGMTFGVANLPPHYLLYPARAALAPTAKKLERVGLSGVEG